MQVKLRIILLRNSYRCIDNPNGAFGWIPPPLLLTLTRKYYIVLWCKIYVSMYLYKLLEHCTEHSQSEAIDLKRVSSLYKLNSFFCLLLSISKNKQNNIQLVNFIINNRAVFSSLSNNKC